MARHWVTEVRLRRSLLMLIVCDWSDRGTDAVMERWWNRSDGLIKRHVNAGGSAMATKLLLLLLLLLLLMFIGFCFF